MFFAVCSHSYYYTQRHVFFNRKLAVTHFLHNSKKDRLEDMSKKRSEISCTDKRGMLE